MSASTEALGLAPNYDRRPGERYDVRPHGTEACARRERRHGRKPCPACLIAENSAHVYRAAPAKEVIMTDPDETANIVGEITAAFREHQAEEAARHPVTYHDASTGNIADQMERYRDLDQHDALAGAIAIGKARGTYEP